MVELRLKPVAYDAVGGRPKRGRGGVVAVDAQPELVSGLATSLSKLGLGDADLSDLISLLQGSRSNGHAEVASREELLEAFSGEDLTKGVKAGHPASSSKSSSVTEVGSPKKSITLFVAEEQQILREAYQSVFRDHGDIEILGSTHDTSVESLVQVATSIKPDVLLLGVKAVQPQTVEMLATLREACPRLALVLLFAYFDGNGIKGLREFSRGATAGCAYLLKHTIDTIEQLGQVIISVAEQRIIVDPMVMEELIRTDDSRAGFMQDLSPKELEVLGWLSRGYRNDTIAGLLSRDVKTIERHINNIYSKLSNDLLEDPVQSMHPRVRAVLMYLKATGLLSADKLEGE